MKNLSSKQILLIAGMVFVGCTKTDKPKPGPGSDTTVVVNNPPLVIKPQPGDLLITVLEYQTDLPISSALYTRSSCTQFNDTGCTMPSSAGSWYSDSAGNILVRAKDSTGNVKPGETKVEEISKENKYWRHYGLDSISVRDSIQYATVRLRPVGWLKIHLKNAFYRNNTVRTLMYLNDDLGDIWVFSPVPSHPFIRYHNLDLPTNNLDTIILVKTFAYIVNELDIQHDTTDIELNYYHYSVYRESRTVNKFDTLVWEVLVK